MTPHRRIDSVLRERLIGWLEWYIEEKRRDGIKITLQELERRLGVAKGAASHMMGGRIGLDNFVKMTRLLHKSADTLLFEDPPRHGASSRGHGSPK